MLLLKVKLSKLPNVTELDQITQSIKYFLISITT